MEAEVYFSLRGGTQKGFQAQGPHRVMLGFTITIEEGKQQDLESGGILLPFPPRSDCSSSSFISSPFSGLKFGRSEAAD